MNAYRIDPSKSSQYAFEMGPIRPPSEGQDCSLLVRVNRNCPWNRCLFCATYKGATFSYRSVSEVKADVDAVKTLYDTLTTASWRYGSGGRITSNLVVSLVRGNPEIYGSGVPSENGSSRVQCLVNVANWMVSGARTVFLQDANAIIMRTPELVEVILYIKENFPSLERVTSYGRAKTVVKKSAGEIKELAEAGLARIHIGLESGCNEVLEYMQKGITAEEHIQAGTKITEAGISLSEYMMPGLGGRRWSTGHALESARVLNAVEPAFIRLRSLIVRRNTQLYQKMADGDFQPLPEDEVVNEIGLFIENLDCHSYLVSDQMSNLLGEIEGQLPGDKATLLNFIRQYQGMPLPQKLNLRLNRRLNSCLAVYGQLTDELETLVETARKAIQDESPEAPAMAEKAITALKQGFI